MQLLGRYREREREGGRGRKVKWEERGGSRREKERRRGRQCRREGGAWESVSQRESSWITCTVANDTKVNTVWQHKPLWTHCAAAFRCHAPALSARVCVCVCNNNYKLNNYTTQANKTTTWNWLSSLSLSLLLVQWNTCKTKAALSTTIQQQQQQQ